MENQQLKKVRPDVAATVVSTTAANRVDLGPHPLGWGEYALNDVEIRMEDAYSKDNADQFPRRVKCYYGEDEWFVVFGKETYTPEVISKWLRVACGLGYQVLNYREEFRQFDPPHAHLTTELVRQKAVNFKIPKHFHEDGNLGEPHDCKDEIKSIRRRLRWLWRDMERLEDYERIISVPPIGGFSTPGEAFADIVADKCRRAIEWCDSRAKIEEMTPPGTGNTRGRGIESSPTYETEFHELLAGIDLGNHRVSWRGMSLPCSSSKYLLTIRALCKARIKRIERQTMSDLIKLESELDGTRFNDIVKASGIDQRLKDLIERPPKGGSTLDGYRLRSPTEVLSPIARN